MVDRKAISEKNKSEHKKRIDLKNYWRDPRRLAIFVVESLRETGHKLNYHDGGVFLRESSTTSRLFVELPEVALGLIRKNFTSINQRQEKEFKPHYNKDSPPQTGPIPLSLLTRVLTEVNEVLS